MTVRVYDWNAQPVGDVRVVGHDADGALVADTASDAAGIAVLTVPPDGSISLVDEPRTGASTVHTVFEVTPGDTIWTRVERGAPWGVPLVVTVPDLPAGATYYELHVPCSGWQGTERMPTIYLTTSCPTRGPLVVTAHGASGVIAYLEMPDVDFAREALTIEGSWMAPSREFTIAVSGVAPAGMYVNFQRTTLVQGYPLAHLSGVLDTTETSATTTRPRFGPGDAVRHRIFSGWGHECVSTDQYLERTSTGELDRITADLGDALPEIPDVVVVDREIRWTGGGGGTYVTIEVATMRPPTGLSPSATWTALAPAGRTSLRFPSGLDAAWPGDSADLYTTDVTEESSSRWATYDDRRTAILDDTRRVEVGTTRGTLAQRGYLDPACR